ncbi:unnamed protein product [Psylliodes chrysocephalus]|uniref:C-type lectin domain-containing protein n=1 Tax=Psylliodes chrysocephalus TaxID=3402493 RepID=A0A9P0CHZ7_9CUCU|nr:unnamed protein product [Psylliodes chrysocephala]
MQIGLNLARKLIMSDTVFKANFYKSLQFCRQQGMHLLSINSKIENDRIGKFILDNGITFGHFWTSASNLAGDHEWIWLSTGRNMYYTNWDQGEPNHAHNSTENCVEVRHWGSSGFTWNDLNCQENLFFICESITDCVQVFRSATLKFAPTQMMGSNLILIIGIFCSTCIVNVDPEEYLSAVLPARKTLNSFRYLGKVYYINTVFQANFYTALHFCRQQGMHLLSISNEAENQKIGNMIKEKGYIGYRFWTSGTNLADKRKWVWSSTGNDVTFFKWAPGEPNNALENSENCLEAGWYKNEQALIWNDIRCSGIELQFICEATTDCHNLHC